MRSKVQQGVSNNLVNKKKMSFFFGLGALVAGETDIYIYIYILDVQMGAKAPIFTRSLWSFRSFSWGDHSDHSALCPQTASFC